MRACRAIPERAHLGYGEDGEGRDALVTVLNGAGGYLRTLISKRHTMRTTPRLRFHYDELVEKGPAMEALIDRALAADGDGADADGA